jgi:beta-glucosidase
MNMGKYKPVKQGIIHALLAFALVCGLMATAFAQGKAEQPSPVYKDPSRPIEQRVADLVSRMTLEEKVRQMQHTAPAIPRLGIPSYDWWGEALHGVARAGYATMFPQAVGMAATWDYNLIHLEGETIATEARAKYNQAQREGNHSIYFGLDFWSPNINICRDPRWGRGQETYGEDPFLTGKLGVAFVTGLQGTDPKYFKVIATPKHYAVHSGPELMRHGFNVTPSPHDLEDTYLPAFRATVVEGHADSVMCAYNAVNGAPACANKYLLQETLRDAWQFKGYVTSDCNAVSDITTGHKFTPDNAHGAAVAVQAGTDTTCGDEYVALVQAVQDGLIKEAEIDTALRRLFTARFRLGMFDPPSAVAFNQIPFTQNDSPEHRQLALRAARESIVLLKNQNGVLPFKSHIKTLAVIGPNAESLLALEGNYKGTPSHPVYPLEGIRKIFAGKAKILYAQGSPYVEELPVPVPSSVFHTAGIPAGKGGSLTAATQTLHPSGEPASQPVPARAPGLKAEYFSNTNFSGRPTLTRVDSQIQFDWDAAIPVPGLSLKAFAVRWAGTLTPPGAGDYELSLSKPHCYPCDDKETVRVYLDGQTMLETVMGRYGLQNPPPTFTLHFADEKPHDFRLEYAHESPLFGGGITLNWRAPVEVFRDEAVRVAQQADAVVACMGLSPNLEGEEMRIQVPGFKGGDRTDISLPAAQEQLLEALAATNKPLVVVLMSGSALAVNWAQEHAAAVLAAWYPGQEGGTAIAETLAGANNPAGRLPVTFYASLDQLPPFEDYSMQNRTYRYFQGKPLYGFGYGLSYSTFEYGDLTLSPGSFPQSLSSAKAGERESTPQLTAGLSLTVQANVRNTSKIAGDEVAELYLEPPQIPGAPRRALRAFTRVRFAAGEKRQVTFTLQPRDLSMVNEEGDHWVMPGEYSIFVGGAQPGETTGGVRAKLVITGETKLPR